MAARLGDLMVSLVDQISHRGGRTLALMSSAAVTLAQILLLARLAKVPSLRTTELAASMGMSLSATSQMSARLLRMGLVSRAADLADARVRHLAITESGRGLLEQLHHARSEEYELGLSRLDRGTRSELARVLRTAVGELGRG